MPGGGFPSGPTSPTCSAIRPSRWLRRRFGGAGSNGAVTLTATAVARILPDSPRTPYGPLWPVAMGWTHPFAPLGTPLVDRDLADPMIDAFLNGLAGADRAAPLCCRLSFPSTAHLRGCSR
jgi:hypothetical protein